MAKKIPLLLFLIFALTLFAVQGYFAWNKDFGMELRAERIGAKYVNREQLTAEAGQAIRGMTVYLTFETENHTPSNSIITVNGLPGGSLKYGVLTLALTEGDILAVKNAIGKRIRIVDPPEGLDENFLPTTVDCHQTVTKWGKISFK